MMELKVTQSSVRDGVALVRLNRPDRGNSWTHRMNAEYRWLMHAHDRDPDVRVIVVTGGGRQFCVGADFRALAHHQTSDEDYTKATQALAFVHPGAGVHEEFEHELVWHWGLNKPVIAAINGACAGIAMSLVAFCDLRYAAVGAKFTAATAKLGLPAEYGLSWVLPRLIGLAPAVDILLTGRVVLAQEMLTLGFVHDVLPAEDFESRVLARAHALASSVSPVAVRAAKRQIYTEQMHLQPGRSIEEAQRLTSELLKLPDCREGIKALQEKRAPVFRPLESTGC